MAPRRRAGALPVARELGSFGGRRGRARIDRQRHDPITLGFDMNPIRTLLLMTSAALALSAVAARGQTSHHALIPHATWDCGMPSGIPAPEAGRLIFELDIPLDRAVTVGQTLFGSRRAAVGLEGSVTGARLSGAVESGALDLELALANGTVEVEQIFVLRASDGTYIYARNAGTGPNAADVRVVMDFEAPNAGQHAWLNAGKFVARRELNAAAKVMRLRVYDVSDVAGSSGTDRSITIAKPTGVPAQ